MTHLLKTLCYLCFQQIHFVRNLLCLVHYIQNSCFYHQKHQTRLIHYSPRLFEDFDRAKLEPTQLIILVTYQSFHFYISIITITLVWIHLVQIKFCATQRFLAASMFLSCLCFQKYHKKDTLKLYQLLILKHPL